MKNITLLLTFVLALTLGAIGQTTYVDFETNANPIGYDFGGNGHTFGVDNPNTTGNTSATVGEITTGAETWSGIAMPIGGTITFSATDTDFTMDVLSDATGDVVLKLENANDANQFVEVTSQYTTADAWETLTFSFPDTLEAGVYSQLVLFFNFGTTEETTWYFDNIVGPSAEFGNDVTVDLNVEDKLGIANTSVSLEIEGELITLTQDGNLWTGQEVLAPYTISEGGGEYETYVLVDDEVIDTTTISVSGGSATMDWFYLILIEEPEDGTANAISVDGTAPVIDGTIDEVWNNAKVHPLQQRDWYGSPTGLYSYFKIMWDADNVYILNYVDDDTPNAQGTDPWMNDNVELFFDMNQSASAGFDSDDWQIRCIRGEDSWTGSENVTDAWAADVERAQTEFADNSGYIVEWAIPWTSLSATFLPLVDFEFNFDVSVADDANDVAGREYIIAWNSNQDINYNNTELYGTVTLSDMTNETAIHEVVNNIPNLSVFPNPVRSQLNIQAGNKIDKVEIFDVVGRTVYNLNDINNKAVSISVDNLQDHAIYMVKITDKEGNINTRKVKVQ